MALTKYPAIIFVSLFSVFIIGTLVNMFYFKSSTQTFIWGGLIITTLIIELIVAKHQGSKIRKGVNS